MPSLRHWLKPSGFRHIGVVNEKYVVSFDGMKMFGVLDLEGCRVSIGMAFETLTTNHDLIANGEPGFNIRRKSHVSRIDAIVIATGPDRYSVSGD